MGVRAHSHVRIVCWVWNFGTKQPHGTKGITLYDILSQLKRSSTTSVWSLCLSESAPVLLGKNASVLSYVEKDIRHYTAFEVRRKFDMKDATLWIYSTFVVGQYYVKLQYQSCQPERHDYNTTDHPSDIRTNIWEQQNMELVQHQRQYPQWTLLRDPHICRRRRNAPQPWWYLYYT